MPLAQQLRTIRRRLRTSVPPAAWASAERLIAGLKAGGIEQRAVAAGVRAPRFALRDGRERTVDLAEWLAQGFVVLSFFRGGWCPYCSAEMRAWRQVVPEIRALGASLIAVSPERCGGDPEGAAVAAPDFEILSDRGNGVARAFGLVFRLADADRNFMVAAGIDLAQRNGDGSWELPVPATYLIGVDGIVRLAFVDADFRRRLDPVIVIDVLRSLTENGS